MPEIRPLRAWRYNKELEKTIDELTSPLFDVVSEKQRERLYQNELNSIHISVPRGDDPFKSAAKTFNDWIRRGIVEKDPIPAIYVYYQYFSLPGSHQVFCRKGFVCNIKAHYWEENKILRHENTIPDSVNDRIHLLETTKLNVSPTHGLYKDDDFSLEKYMDESMQHPLYETEDYQGVRDVLSVIHDKEVIEKFRKIIKGRNIILADGHHRYESSLAYRRQMEAQNPNHNGEEGYNYHLMYLTNSSSDHLRVLPTHRLVKGLEAFNKENILQKLQEYFSIRELEDPFDINQIIAGKQHAFGLIFKDSYFKIRLKQGLENEISWNFPYVVKKLDLTVLHYYFIQKVLGIRGRDQRTDKHLEFERNFSTCLSKVHDGEAQIALITNEIEMDQIIDVCHSGFTLPQKSTYFYPKVICGFLFSSIEDD